MIQFTSHLKKEIDAKIEQVERSEISMITKSLEASRVLADAFYKLKVFILSYSFENEEEILFFKEIKPRLCSRLIYYRKVYNIEMNRPTGIEKQREYLCELLNDINKYNTKRLDFIRYYRSCSSHLDTFYFLRGKTDTEQYQLLKELLTIQKDTQQYRSSIDLITSQELIAIQVMWYRDGNFTTTINDIYNEVYGYDLQNDNMGLQERLMLEKSCNNPAHYMLIQELLALQKNKVLLMKKYGLQTDLEARLDTFIKEVEI